MTTITITTPGSHFLPEYTYLVKLIFKDWLDSKVRLIPGNQGKWIVSCGENSITFPNILFPEHSPRKFYDGEIIQRMIFPHKILGSDLIFPFGLDGGNDLSSIDILGSIFFFITCYEDTFFNRNEFNKTLAPKDSFAYKYSLHLRPFIEEMLVCLTDYCRLNKIFFNIKKQKYRLLYSCDIDVPAQWYKASLSSLIRASLAAILKHKSLNRLHSIFSAYSSIEKDIFYTFPWIISKLNKYGLKGCFNLKGGVTCKKYDRYYDVTSTWIRDLLTLLTKNEQEIGFHPSYATPENPNAFIRELKAVQDASPTSVIGGRQHYLRFTGSNTWRMWNRAGLKYDSTIAFNRASGFRVGTAREFPVYDLIQREELRLSERPLIIMDGTLLGYENLSHQEAFDKACQFSHQIKKYGGNMTLLWHNSYLETQEKRELFSQLLKYLS